MEESDWIWIKAGDGLIDAKGSLGSYLTTLTNYTYESIIQILSTVTLLSRLDMDVKLTQGYMGDGE